MSRMPEPSLTPPEYFSDDDEPSDEEMSRVQAISALLSSTAPSPHIAAGLAFELSEYITKLHFPGLSVRSLLTQLRHMVRWHDQLQADDIARARAVIAKAEGRPL